MRINRLYIAVGFVIAFAMFFEIAAHADETNQQTRITFSAPVQIPGQILPAGTYIFEKADPSDDQNLVRIFNADRSVLYATLQTVSADRREPTGDTVITMAAPEDGGPELLVKWFYPGELIGHEFMYIKQQEQQIAHATKETVVGDRVLSGSEAAGN